MARTLTLYGFFLFSHGWARILTVMSPQGASTIRDSVEPGDGARLQFRVGALPQFHEIRDGALDRLIAEHRITVLDRPEWDARKAEYGNSIYL